MINPATVRPQRFRQAILLLFAFVTGSAAGAQTINGYYAGQGFSTGTTVYINPCNALAAGQGNTGVNCVDGSLHPVTSVNFPTADLSFQIAAPYNTAAYTIEWAITVDYTDKGGKSNIYLAQTTGADGVPGNQSWTVPWAFGPAGGSASVNATVFFQCNPPLQVGQTVSFPFTIWGANPSKSDPANSIGDSNLILLSSAWHNVVGGEPPWFVTPMMTLESDHTDDQFCIPAEANISKCSYTPGTPRWGGPDGIGVMQVDRTQYPGYWPQGRQDVYWNYATNIQDGWAILSGKMSKAQADWSTEIAHMCESIPEEPDGSGGCIGGHEVPYKVTVTHSQSYKNPQCTNAETAGSNEPVEVAFPQPPHTVSGVVANGIQLYNGGYFIRWLPNAAGWSQTTNPYLFVVCNLPKYYEYPF